MITVWIYHRLDKAKNLKYFHFPWSFKCSSWMSSCNFWLNVTKCSSLKTSVLEGNFMQFNFRCSTFISTNLVSTFLQDNAHRNQCFETQALLKQKFLINFLQTFQPKILLLFCYPQSWSKLSLRKQPFLRAPRCFLHPKRLQWQRARRNRCFNRLIATLSFGSC